MHVKADLSLPSELATSLDASASGSLLSDYLRNRCWLHLIKRVQGPRLDMPTERNQLFVLGGETLEFGLELGVFDPAAGSSWWQRVRYELAE